MRFPRQIISILSFTLLLYSCSRIGGAFQRKERVYQPPRLGAEYRFEDGLRRQKNPQDLFSKKERKDMLKLGMRSEPGQRPTPKTQITPMQADSLLTGKTRDTTTQAIPKDSTQRMPADTAHPRAGDTTSLQR